MNALFLAKSLYRNSREGFQIGKSQIRKQVVGKLSPAKPETLNLLVNDICNSKCQMCNIWQRKIDKQLTPGQLFDILSDPLFSELKYIGISGGEPTLRSDLPELYDAICRGVPQLKGTGIITNAINTKQVISRITDSVDIVSSYNIPFSTMISVDGVGKTHDLVRGVKGNFTSAFSVLHELEKLKSTTLAIGCTVTKSNVWGVAPLLDYAKNEGIYIRFRVAEFIKRLYNESQTESIRCFTDEERYHLGLFFWHLELKYEQDVTIQNTYRSIRGMLLREKNRSSACPWRTNAVTLDCRGQLLYCAPKSPVIGDLLSRSESIGWDIYKDNLHIRNDIIKNDCNDCIHDYHGGKTFGQWTDAVEIKVENAAFSMKNALRASSLVGDADQTLPRKTPHRVLISGWYGTETAGDKAILAELILQYKKEGVQEIAVASLYPDLTYWTLKELGHPEIEIVNERKLEFIKKVIFVDEVAMGGGPLMEINELKHILFAFATAQKSGTRTRIAGCGIGPLHKNTPFLECVKELLRLAHDIELRDQASVRFAMDIAPTRKATMRGDPAEAYVKRIRTSRPKSSDDSRFFHLYLREWPAAYAAQYKDDFEEMQKSLERELGLWVQKIARKTSLRPKLFPMHHFTIGSDDREFARRFTLEHLAGTKAVVIENPLPLSSILESFTASKFNICMRFHSVLFASTLNTPFWAIDYTIGGKIHGYLTDHNQLDNLVPFGELLAGNAPYSAPPFQS